jgi:hypothetical protein
MPRSRRPTLTGSSRWRAANGANAEADTLLAIDHAYATDEQAEYSVLDAISARREDDDLAMRSSSYLENGSAEPSTHGPCRDRTYDLGIKSPLLYQLS